MKSVGRRNLYVAMDITDRCNLRCAMCIRTAIPWTPGPDLTVEQFRTIGDHCFGRAVVLSLSCVSEPLLSKHFVEIMGALQDYRVPSTELVTNGMLLDEEKIAVVPGSAFGAGGDGFVRCSYATAYEKIEEALERMARFVQRHG